jgi:transposase
LVPDNTPWRIVLKAFSHAAPSGKGTATTSKKVDDTLFETMSVIHPNTAGIDIGSEIHYVSVPEGRSEPSVRTFGCFTPDLAEMAKWLKECGISHVVLESTGVYWVATYQTLIEAGFDVKLVDARHAKNVPGRKTDVWDCRWLRKLHTFGLLQGCFLPPKEAEVIRTYWRQRANLVAMASQQTLRMQKALELMNIQLHKVLSDTVGVTGLLIIRSLVAGERDPEKLAQYRQKNVKHSEETFIKALTGNYQSEHLFGLKQSLEFYDFIQQQLHACDTELEKYLVTLEDKSPPSSGAGTPPGSEPEACPKRGKLRPSKNEPKFDLHAALVRISGVDLTEIDGINSETFATVISECGTDLKRFFPTEKHFCSWLGLSPNNQITGGKVRSRRTRKVQNRVANALRIAAQSLHHSQSALGAFYRRMVARLGAPKAITATAHKLARLVWRLLTYGQAYVDIGQGAYEKQMQERAFKALSKRAATLGYSLVNKDTGEVLA